MVLTSFFTDQIQIKVLSTLPFLFLWFLVEEDKTFKIWSQYSVGISCFHLHKDTYGDIVALVT